MIYLTSVPFSCEYNVLRDEATLRIAARQPATERRFLKDRRAVGFLEGIFLLRAKSYLLKANLLTR